MDRHRPGRELKDLAITGPIIGTLARHLDGRIGGRNLHNGAHEAGKQRLDLVALRPRIGGRYGPAFCIVAVGADPPADAEPVAFLAVLHERDGFGRFTERDREDAGGQRIERAGMTGLFRIEQELEPANRLG